MQGVARKPDIVFSKRKKVIFVNGCFWHGHDKCNKGKLPKSRAEYWEKKINENKIRDRSVCLELKKGGWDALVIWECEICKKQDLDKYLIKFLGRIS